MRSAEWISSGWEAAACRPDSHLDPAALDGLEWLPATVPGTAAEALSAAGLWRPGERADLDGEDWWFRARFDAAPAADGEEVTLRLDGIATVAEVFLNGRRVLESDSMFAAHELDVGSLLLGDGNELTIRCRALAPLLGTRRKPRARWRTKLADGRLRFFRTTLLGRAPGFAPGPPAVGPWRPVRLVRHRAVALAGVRLRTSLRDAEGLLVARIGLRTIGDIALESAELQLQGASGSHHVSLELEPNGDEWVARGELRVPSVARWWPHTHGEPVLHGVGLRLECGAESLYADLGRVGFRDLSAGADAGHEVAVEGLDLHVNGVRVFARGAVWTPEDPVGMAPGEERLRTALERARDAGMNMLRIPGTSAYESPLFHDLCDELGILVWQDFMFANFDYPLADERFRALVESEAEGVLAAIAGRPSTAVLCGNSEVEQQAAMFGADPALGRGDLFGELLPRLVAEAGADAPYIPSAPCGGARPFVPDRGIANYYGVGGYRRPLSDARLAGVRFAAECLAFANVPDEAAIDALLPEGPAEVVVHHPRWKAGVPRDAGAGWDFDDVRDHYLAQLFDVDPAELRRSDHDRYLQLSRAVSGEVMAAVFGEWRRAGSPCGGGLVLWMKDLAPGAGWGLVDHAGKPKSAFHHLRRAFAPVAVWMTDEGLGGIAVHVANDADEPLEAGLRLGLYADWEQPVADAATRVALDPHATASFDLESLLGRFADPSWAYRFGPAAQNLIVASLEREPKAAAPLSRSFHLPAGRPSAVETPERLGLEASATAAGEGRARLSLRSERFVYGVRVSAELAEPEDDAFSLEPGVEQVVMLKPVPGVPISSISVSALNMRGRVAAAVQGAA
jgi:beta-mannosidase